MRDAALLTLVFIAIYAGFTCLAVSQRSRWASLLDRAASRGTIVGLRSLGVALLLLSFAASVGRDGWSFGSAVWCTLISIAAVAVVVTLAFRPRWIQAIFVVVLR